MAEIEKIEKIKRFLSYFGDFENIEISSGSMAYGIEILEQRNRYDEAYFLGEIKDAKKILMPRKTADDVIFQKKYFYIDFDVRQGHFNDTCTHREENGKKISNEDGVVLSDEEVLEIELKMREAINEIEILKDWTFIVFTGNGFHYHRIGDKSLVIGKETYRKAMEYIMEMIRGKFVEKGIDVKVDPAPRNIARLARLPYTINHSRVKKFGKYGIKAGESYVLEARRGVRTELLGIFESLAVLYGDDVEVTEHKPKKEFYPGSSITIDEINEIPIEDLVYGYCSAALNRDGKNFISPKHGGPTGMYKKGNCVARSGTHYINEPSQPAVGDKKIKGYNPYTLVREHYCNGDDARTFDWFRDNYDHIRKVDDENRKKYGEFKKQENAKKFVNDENSESRVVKDEEIENDRNENLKNIKDVKDIYRGGVMVEFMVDELNDKLKKIHLGTLNILVGSPNSGKTTFSYLMMKHNLTRLLKVGFLSYEMQFRDIIEQYYFRQIGAMDRFMDAKITEDDNNKTNKHKEELITNKNFLHYECLNSNLETLKIHIDKLSKFGANVIFIDNLIKIRRTENELLDNTKVIEYLYRVSHERDIAIIILHHTDKVAAIKNLLSFRGTGDIQIKPDNLFYIKRPGLSMELAEPTELEKAELTVKKVKQRLGKASLEETEIYFFRGEYYSLHEYMQIKNTL